MGVAKPGLTRMGGAVGAGRAGSMGAGKLYNNNTGEREGGCFMYKEVGGVEGRIPTEREHLSADQREAAVRALRHPRRETA